MPKAKPYPGDEEERTSAESQWEDEASTTVEQGDVAERIRGLGVEPGRRVVTGITDTGATGVEESTVDDQSAHPALAATPAPRDARVRLVVTQGNEIGQEIAFAPGKTYTIGRATDNDFVLTDIAVSRKHFDVRCDDGAWVIVDRGSGNGTVVNGNIEDNPFMLATGDLIEIGNTVFRFEDAAGPPRRSMQSYELQHGDDDDDEMSTVAGKPMRELRGDEPPPLEPPQMARPERPKTVPPPAPLPPRPHAPSAGPNYPALVPPQLQQLQPASTLPLPQMAARAPHAPPGAPTLLAMDSMPSIPVSAPLPGVMPTTIPGQGGLPSGRQMQQYPMATEIPPHSVHAQMLRITANAGRTDPSTALVAPTPYAMPMNPPQMAAPYVAQPQPMSKKTKYAIGAASLAVLAAISTIAIVRSGNAKSAPVVASASSSGSGAAALGTASLKLEPVRVAKAVEEPAPKPAVEIKPEVKPEIKPEPKPEVAPPPAPPPVQAKKEPPKRETPKETPRKKERERVATPTPQPAEERAAPAPNKRDADAIVKQATQLYAAKKFNEASNLLKSASKGASGQDAANLHHTQDNIDNFARQYNMGTAPAASPTEQFDRLRAARGYDTALGGGFSGELEQRLKEISTKAALTFYGGKNYEKALAAVQTAESLGVADGNVKTVRSALDKEAGKLYNEAAAKQDSDPKGAKDDLRRLKLFVDKKSQWSDKADKLLRQLDK